MRVAGARALWTTTRHGSLCPSTAGAGGSSSLTYQVVFVKLYLAKCKCVNLICPGHEAPGGDVEHVQAADCPTASLAAPMLRGKGCKGCRVFQGRGGTKLAREPPPERSKMVSAGVVCYYLPGSMPFRVPSARYHAIHPTFIHGTICLVQCPVQWYLLLTQLISHPLSFALTQIAHSPSLALARTPSLKTGAWNPRPVLAKNAMQPTSHKSFSLLS